MLMTEVHADSSSPSCLEMCKKWLTDCQEHHSRCPRTPRHHVISPARLLHVGQESTQPHLVDVDGSKAVEWAALSYCWGGGSDFKLTKKTSHQFYQGVPLASFPATLRDAIIVTRALGLTFLWIDSLCILQDLDPASKSEWQREAAKMSDIYKGAAVTIAATKAKSVNDGFLGPRALHPACKIPWRFPKAKDSPDHSARSESTDPVDTHVHLRLQGPGLAAGESDSHCRWSRRGWCMQESLVSTRLLSFNERQIVFDCVSSQADEGGQIRPGALGSNFKLPMGRGNFHHLKALQFRSMALRQDRHLEPPSWRTELPTPDVEDETSKHAEKLKALWHTLVRDYSKRSLTRCTDALPAISSLARGISSAFPSSQSYRAGLFEADLKDLGLLWYSTEWKGERPADYIAPSWSWPSAIGNPIEFWRSVWSVKILFKVQRVQVQPKGVWDMFGQLASGRLIIDAPCYRSSTLNPVLASRDAHSLNAFETFVNHFFKNNTDMAKEFPYRHQPHSGQEFAVLQMAQKGNMGIPDSDEFECYEHTEQDIRDRIHLLFLETTEDFTDPNSAERVYKRVATGVLYNNPPGKRDPEEGEVERDEIMRAAWTELEEHPWSRQTVIII